MDFDVFICHAGEDKDAIARPLAEGLRSRGLRVWFDEHILVVGSSLSESIDQGLARSQFGVVVLSPSFFGKAWPRRELAGLVAKEVAGVPAILPVWHELGREEVLAQSPTLADRWASKSSSGIEQVIEDLTRAIAVASEVVAGRGGVAPPESVEASARFEVLPPPDRLVFAPGNGTVEFRYSVVQVLNRGTEPAALDVAMDVDAEGRRLRSRQSYRLVVAPGQVGHIAQAVFTQPAGNVAALGGDRAASQGNTLIRVTDLISGAVESHPL